MKNIFLIVIFACFSIGWFSPRTSTNQTASQDLLATSTDTHDIGNSSLIWKHGYFRYLDLKETLSPETPIASHGQIFVSTDAHIYYINSAATITKMDD